MLKFEQDRLQHAVGILQHVVVPEAQYSQALPFEKARSTVILRDLVGMLSSVQLENETPLAAKKVANEWANRHLAAELETSKPPISQMKP